MRTRREFLLQAASAGIAAAASPATSQSAASLAATGPLSSMKTSRIPHADLEVSRLAYGLGMLGIDSRSSDFTARTVAAIRTAYEHGITFFDTADTYAAGRSELALGEVLKNSPALRQKLVIQSKCGLRVADGWVPGDPVRADTFSSDLSREHIVSAAERTLLRIGSDYLDILLLHAPDHLMRPDDVAQAFDQLHASGKVRHFGVSSFNVVQIEVLRKCVRQPLVSNQIRLGLGYYSAMAESSSFGGLVDYCRAQEIQVQAFAPLKVGNSGTTMLLNPSQQSASELITVARLLAAIARGHETTAAVIMLAWLMHHPADIVPITGATKREHLIENCTAHTIHLSNAEWTALFRAAAAIQQA